MVLVLVMVVVLVLGVVLVLVLVLVYYLRCSVISTVACAGDGYCLREFLAISVELTVRLIFCERPVTK